MEQRKWDLAPIPADEACLVHFEGRELHARRGEPLMVTLLAHGIDIAARSVKYHRPRGAYCLAGACGQCWMRVDDLPNRPACLAIAQEQRHFTRQNAFPSVDTDLFRAADLVFFGGFDHHRLGTTPIGPLNTVMQSTARQMAGMGALSDKAPDVAPKIVERRVDVLIVGGGPAGMAAALLLSKSREVLLVEQRSSLGGQLRSGLFSDQPQLATLSVATKTALGDNVWLRATATGIYEDSEGPQVLVLLRDPERLAIVRPRRLLLAQGGYEQTPLFGGNDLPGHYGVRALAELALVHGVLPGKKLLLQGQTEIAQRLAAALRAKKFEVQHLEDQVVLAAKGSSRVKGAEVGPPGGPAKSRQSCDMIASAQPVAPAYELAQQGGASVHFVPGRGFVVTTDFKARTANPWIRAAGELSGATSALEAWASGQIAAQGLLED